MKKILAVALALVTVICLFAACDKNGGTKGNPDAEVLSFENYEYVVLEDGNLKITKYIGTNLEEELNIPETIESKVVTVIGESAFEGCELLRRVNLPRDLVTIEEKAFAGSSAGYVFCTSGASLETIGAEAFKDCANLIQFDIKAVKTIGKDAFAGCSALQVFTLRTDADLTKDAFGDANNFKVVTHEECEKLIKFAKDSGHDVQIF